MRCPYGCSLAPLGPRPASFRLYRRRRLLAAAGAVAALVVLASALRIGSPGGSPVERLVGAILLVGWVAAGLALWSWDRAAPPRREAGSRESCLSPEPASPAAA